MERVTGIEPVPVAWKATVLPLNYTRKVPALPRTGGLEAGAGGAIRCLQHWLQNYMPVFRFRTHYLL